MTSRPHRTARPLSAEQASRARWDLVVIGAGSAGLVGARTAAALGARVLLIEGGRFGGECLHTGCIPSKALIAAADAAQEARDAGRFGVSAGTVSIDPVAVMAHVRAAIEQIAPVDSPDALAAAGVHTLAARAHFDGPRSVVAGGRRIRFRDALIATGSSPARPDPSTTGAVDVLTNESFWELDRLPTSLLIIGGGAVGCELAQALSRLGSRVVLAHRGDRLLPKEDPDASRIVEEALRADGVDVRLSTTLVGAGAAPDGATEATLSDGTSVTVQRLFAALGRQVETAGLGLDAAGVALDPSGAIAVDSAMRTSNPRIRAAGDVTPLPRFTHAAGAFASTAASNAVLGISRRVDPDRLPRVTFTSPEVAAIGLSRDAASSRDQRVVDHPHDHVDRAVTDGRTTGFTRIVLDRTGRIVGATIVGPRAGESLGELSLAVSAGRRARDLAAAVHAYPTYSDGVWNAAIAGSRGALTTPVARFAIRVLRGLRRR